MEIQLALPLMSTTSAIPVVGPSPSESKNCMLGTAFPLRARGSVHPPLDRDFLDRLGFIEQILPAQTKKKYSSGELELMVAVLEQGIKEARRTDPIGESARRWIAEDSEYIFSFKSLCENLDLSPQKIRRLLCR